MSYLKISKFLFGIIAAGLWFWSAAIKTPKNFSFSVVKPDMESFGDPLGGKYLGQAYSPELLELASKLVEQSNLNRFAAFFTAVTVVLDIF